MGVYITLLASNKVDPVQWEKAYEETLILADKMGLIEIREFEKFGQKYFAATSSIERKHPCGIGWLACPAKSKNPYKKKTTATH